MANEACGNTQDEHHRVRDHTARRNEGDIGDGTTDDVDLTSLPAINNGPPDNPDDDYPADSSTTGTIAVNGSASDVLEVEGDRDWFAVQLTEGRRYQFSIAGPRGSKSASRASTTPQAGK